MLNFFAMIIYALLSTAVLLSIYLWHANRAISTAPPQATKVAQKPWTKGQIENAYKKAQISPTDVTPFLFRKKDRRYIVVGGSGRF